MKKAFSAIILMLVSGVVFAVLSGEGTEDSPYLIQSRADFDEFCNPANAGVYWSGGTYTTLTCDLELSATPYPQAPIAPSSSTPFAGVFDGDGHTLSGLTIAASSTRDYTGLFGTIDASGQLKDLVVTDVTVTGGRYAVSGLTGWNEGTITRCYVTGSVAGYDENSHYVGGLSGWNAGTLAGCRTNCTVSGSWNVGGLAGYNNGGIISDCSAAGSAECFAFSVGGLAGYNGNNGARAGTIVDSHATGTVTAGFDSAGGLVGYNTDSSVILNCYATGAVSGVCNVGGLAGFNNSTVAISNCYAAGNATGTGSSETYVGGLVGKNSSGIISRCYATGAVHGERIVGGLVGWNDCGTVQTSYATGTATGTSVYVGGLAGRISSHTSSSSVSNCYATGAVSGAGGVGGLIGHVQYLSYACTVSYCYAAGPVTSSGTKGGLTGLNQYGTYTACFWDTTVSGLSDPVGYNFGSLAGMLGRNTAAMKTQSTFTDHGWDFISETDNGSADLWRMCVDGIRYPGLSWAFSNHGDFVCPDGVSTEDLAVFSAWWLSAECDGSNDCQGTDITADGNVNLKDFAIFAAHWLTEN